MSKPAWLKKLATPGKWSGRVAKRNVGFIWSMIDTSNISEWYVEQMTGNSGNHLKALESCWTRTTWNWNSVAPIEMSMTPLKKHHQWVIHSHCKTLSPWDRTAYCILKRERGESTVFRHKTAKSSLAASFWVSRAVFPFLLNFPCPRLPVEKLNIEKNNMSWHVPHVTQPKTHKSRPPVVE